VPRVPDPVDPVVQRAIDFYFDYFGRKAAEAAAIRDRVFRRIVLVALISAMAEGRFYTERSDSDKFIKLVKHFGNWTDIDRVSVVQLKHLVTARQGRSAHYGGFSQQFLDALERHHSVADKALEASEVRRASADPLPDEMFPFELTGDERSAVRKSSHGYLLYQYRSTLVHEAREPGGGFELRETDTVPYYMPTTHTDGSRAAELTYPLGLLMHVITSIIANLPAWYVRERISPYDRHRFGSQWVR
jgi:hypothetical protein